MQIASIFLFAHRNRVPAFPDYRTRAGAGASAGLSPSPMIAAALRLSRPYLPVTAVPRLVTVRFDDAGPRASANPQAELGSED